MKVNFLENICKEPAINDSLFGLCDDQNGQKAYSNTDNPIKWIATVKNEKGINLIFTPVDNCLIKSNEFIGRGRCDGLLTSNEHLYFIELKDQTKKWITQAVEQIESTIDFFKESHDINSFRHKKAFVCNKQHRHFQEVDNEINLSFFRKHKVRLDIQADIIVI